MSQSYLLVAPLLGLTLAAGAHAAGRHTQNVVLITLDGVRTQEIFGGLDLEILKSVVKKGNAEERKAYQKYWAATPQERREKLMPFFWGSWMKKHGHIYGNRSLESTVTVANKHRFSYPGYSEILTGQAHDDVIDSNDNKRNPYPSVLEFLRKELELPPQRVAAFCSWETMNWIAEHKEGTIAINAGFEAYRHPEPTISELSRLQFETLTPWRGVRHDAYTFRFAAAHLTEHQPRVLFLGFGETDDWAHDGDYELVLEALHQADDRFRRLWEFLERHRSYRGRTSIVITTDHGRGNGPADWKSHGKDIEGAQYIWLGIVSPDSARRGEQSNTETIYQNQIAATLCRFLRIDYSRHNPAAGKPVSY